MHEKPKTVAVIEETGGPQRMLDMSKKKFLPYGGVMQKALLHDCVGDRTREET